MAGDTPGFFSHIPDSPEGQSAAETFAEAAGEKQVDETPAANNNPTDQKAGGDSDKKNNDGQKNDQAANKDGEESGSQDGSKNQDGEGANKSAEPSKEGEKPNEEDKTKEGDGEKKTDPQNLILGKYKTVEEAQAAIDADREALSKLTKPSEPDKLDEEIKAILQSPVVDLQIPNPELYNIEEDDGNGGKIQKFDINSFMGDYTRSLLLGIQKEMLGGRLMAAQFGMLQKALGENSQRQLEEAQREEFANSITTKLFEKYPAIKSDEKLQEKLERLIYGEQARRQKAAEMEGKKPEEAKPMEYDDFDALAMEVLAAMPQQPQPPEQPTEQPKGGAALINKESTTEDDEILSDIDNMMAAKGKGRLF